MEYAAVLDVSSIIWDEDDYRSNTQYYYAVVDHLLILFETLAKEKTSILLRKELHNEMINGFPLHLMPMQSRELRDFGNSVYLFLTNISSSINSFQNNAIKNVSSIPNLIKKHYNSDTQDEIHLLISRIHSEQEKIVYFTFKYFWGKGGSTLRTVEGATNLHHIRIISDHKTDLPDFFERVRRKFDGSPKHYTMEGYMREGGKYVSPLSCYNYRKGDKSIAQQLLDTTKKSKSGKNYYNYDTTNDVWVVFKRTEENTNLWHGYDERDREKIPSEIRKWLHK